MKDKPALVPITTELFDKFIDCVHELLDLNLVLMPKLKGKQAKLVQAYICDARDTLNKAIDEELYLHPPPEECRECAEGIHTLDWYEFDTDCFDCQHANKFFKWQKKRTEGK